VTPALEATRLGKVFGATTAVADVSFAVAPGEIVGFLGPNGAGKTTTMRILAGVFPPTTGVVRIAGRDPAREPLACRRAVGYLPESAPSYPELRVDGHLGFVARLKRLPADERRAAVARVVDACGLGSVARRPIGTLSKGFRQRVGLAQALCGDPAILILDEPTIGLDPAQVVEMRELILRLRGRRTVFFSSHILSEVAAVADRVIVIARGRIVAEGMPDDLQARLGRRRRVRLRVDGPPSAVAATLRAATGVLAVAETEAGFVLEASPETELARTAGELMQRAGWPVLELAEEPVDLERLFLDLVAR